MRDHRPDLRLVQQPGVDTTLELIANARRSLAEARTLPDIRRVMEAATVAVDAAYRMARLAEAQQAAAEVVDAATSRERRLWAHVTAVVVDLHNHGRTAAHRLPAPQVPYDLAGGRQGGGAVSDELVMTEIECQVALLAARVFRTMSQSFLAKGNEGMAAECLRNA